MRFKSTIKEAKIARNIAQHELGLIFYFEVQFVGPYNPDG